MTYCINKPFIAIQIINAASSLGQRKSGVELGPEAILADEFDSQLLQLKNKDDQLIWKEIKVLNLKSDFEKKIDCFGDVLDKDVVLESEGVNERKISSTLHYPRTIGAFTEILYESVRQSLETKSFSLILGGDHSMAIGSVAGSLAVHPELCVLWIDAHSDINTVESTKSGNLHGCPVSFLMNIGKGCELEGFEWLKKLHENHPSKAVLSPSRIAYIGLRDVERAEKALLKRLNISAFSMTDIIEHGVANIFSMAIRQIDPEGNKPIHLSFDIDSIDPLFAPSTGTPVPGGLLEREGKYIAEKAFDTGRLVSMDLVEVNPSLGSKSDQEKTVSTARNIIFSAMGDKFL